MYRYPSGLLIATKGGLTRTNRWSWSEDGRPDYLRSALEGSLKRLQTNRKALAAVAKAHPKGSLIGAAGSKLPGPKGH